MGTIVLGVIGSVAALAVVILVFLRFVTGMAERMGARPHNDGQEIARTGLVPVGWGGRGGPAAAQRFAGLKKRRALARLARVVRYYRHTPLVESEAERKNMVERLRDVRRQWRARPWREIYPWR